MGLGILGALGGFLAAGRIPALEYAFAVIQGLFWLASTVYELFEHARGVELASATVCPMPCLFQLMAGLSPGCRSRYIGPAGRASETVGYSDLTVHDHLTPQLAPVALLTAVAMATERLRPVSARVSTMTCATRPCLPRRLATIDVLSEGRLVVGIGAGWNEPEYKRSIGLSFDPPAVRISRMLEAVTILRGLFGD